MRSAIKSIFLSIVTIIITCSLIIFPEQSLNASIRGLHAWWEVVFPSLLPFFITAELLISFGVVQFIGILFEPIMRPLFNVPGIGSFAWIVGMASGYPAGAKISTRLREKNEISQIEAERLVSFSNASSPLFIFGAIAVGFFHNAKLGIFIAICHYLSNVLVGLCMRFYKFNKSKRYNDMKNKSNIFMRALKKMHYTRIKDPRPFGEILGDSVITSVQTLVMIGGFIILFSVFTTLLQLIHIADIIQFGLTPLLVIFHIPKEIITPLMTGIFEITMGADLISKLSKLPLYIQLALISFILGFNGFSVQAQVASIISKTDIRFYPYFFARTLHAFLACALTIFLYKFFEKKYLFLPNDPAMVVGNKQDIATSVYEFFTYIGPIITIITISLTFYLLINRYKKRRTNN